MTPTEHWLGRLIAHPTVSADSNLSLIDELEQALTAVGADCIRFPDQSGQKAALLARLGPDVPGGLMLSGHVDVVPAAGQDWTVPPFELTRRGGRLFGRGTTDMKGFVAAMLALAARAPVLSRPLWLAISYDEEVGCIGVRPLLAAVAGRNIRPDLVVVGEPTSMRLGLGHKGKLAFTVTAKGEARHSSEAPLALNALHLAGDFMAAMRTLQDELAAHGPSEQGYSVPYATVHVGRLIGGTVVNLVPDSAELLMELRLLAADDPAALTSRLRDLADQLAAPHRTRFPTAALTVTETGGYPGLSTPHGAAVDAFAACLPPGTAACKLSYGTEAGLFARSLGVPVVVCGPGDMAQGHRPDEYIEASQLAVCDTALDAALARFCLASDPAID
ncbi:MAG: acetylornithine deacetylase [Pseudotabrizicola sp.]|uniref:acetylornithine deacetylase n=1 Tax=Pseudotabrizicola sp. TaxID=2939647 RepID=UPI00273174EF|nr:acetylornithine deacetylase [Pseudotabrizicola sp.]MDP2082525.1 acetylornithine deacetylase [Pseudotabrizicola sp.]MDZ7573964.1 acetylornithine deacetylase [Pseudotabrizicola sp.]